MRERQRVGRGILTVGQSVGLLLLCSAAALAQSPQGRKAVEVARSTTPPTIDGSLGDTAWAGATIIEDLHQFEPVDHGNPSERSTFYVLYDDDFLYIGARLLDSEPGAISARQLIQGQSVDVDDRIELIIDPFNNMRSGYRFQLNPNGVRRDGVFEGPTQVNADWDGIWNAEASIDDEGWTGEIAIPFKTLNFDPNNSDWGFTVARAIPRKKERMAWTSLDRDINPSSTGLLTGFSGLQQGRGLDIVPSISVTGSRDFVTNSDDSETDPSLDVFYNFTPSLTGVLTFNTDFSATEVDDRQVNLTRFSLFFPEKRDFFLQDLDIFTFGPRPDRGGGPPGRNGMPFFSRRIGLSDTGQPVDLEVGAKLTGRAGRFNVGMLSVKQDEYQGRRGVIDESDLFVGRVAANVLEESSVGVIVTDGNPRSNLDNSLAGVDFRYRNSRVSSGNIVEAAAWYQESDTEGVTAEQASWGVELELPASQGFFTKLEYEVIEENFNPSLGFRNRSGFERKRVRGGYRWRPRGQPWLRFAQTFATLEQYNNDVTGALETQNFVYRPIRLINHAGDQYSLMIRDSREVLTEPFEISEGIVIQPGDYDIQGYQLEAFGAQERVFAPRLVIGDGDFYEGTRFHVEGGIDWRPSSRWYVGAGYEYNDIELPVGNFTTRLIQLRANLAFNVRWSWVNLIQYDNVSKTVGVNSRLRWNPRAGEDLYIVWNHQADAAAAFSGLRSRRSEFTVKYSRTFRF